MKDHGESTNLTAAAIGDIVSVFTSTIYAYLTYLKIPVLQPSDLRAELNRFKEKQVVAVICGTYSNSDSLMDPSIAHDVNDTKFGASVRAVCPGFLVIDMFVFLATIGDVGSDWRSYLNDFDGFNLQLYGQLQTTFHHCVLAATNPSLLSLMGRKATSLQFAEQHGLDTVIPRTVQLGHIGNLFSRDYDAAVHKLMLLSLMTKYLWTMGHDGYRPQRRDQ